MIYYANISSSHTEFPKLIDSDAKLQRLVPNFSKDVLQVSNQTIYTNMVYFLLLSIGIGWVFNDGFKRGSDIVCYRFNLSVLRITPGNYNVCVCK